jgi:hypothetical protein
MTAVAPLPSLLFGGFDKCLGLGIFRTVARRMHFLRTVAAYKCLAVLALPDLSTFLHGDVVRFDPCTTLTRWTVDAILGLVLLKLAIPKNLEFLVEQLVNVFEINVLVCTAPRRHMSGI